MKIKQLQNKMFKQDDKNVNDHPKRTKNKTMTVVSGCCTTIKVNNKTLTT